MSIETVLEFLREGDVTVGIDLSAQAKNTGIAAIRWDGAEIVDFRVDHNCVDDDLIRLIINARGKIGIDCPFGWPVAFIDLIGKQRGVARSGQVLETPGDRKKLTFRETDLFVIKKMRKHKEAGLSQDAPRPLSVSSDRIAIVAMRLAGFRARLPEDVIQNDGSGTCVEVYPAAALALWGVPSRGYKGSDARPLGLRQEIVKQLKEKLDLPEGKYEELVASDHVLDAFLCAIIAKDAELVETTQSLLQGLCLTDVQRAGAAKEGWIHLPRKFENREGRIAVFRDRI